MVVLLNISMETDQFISRIWWIESSKEQKWFEIELFRYNTCLYLNVSLQNKSV